MNLQGQMIYYNNESPAFSSSGQEKIEDLFKRACETLKKHAEELNLQLIGIGLGLPALLNSKKGAMVVKTIFLAINDS